MKPNDKKEHPEFEAALRPDSSAVEQAIEEVTTLE